MKKILVVTSMIAILLLTACGAEVVATWRLEADVVVVDSYHRDAWTQPIWTGKFWTYIHHSETNKITVYYEGGRFDIDDEDLYNKYCDSIGETVTGVFEITTYDDGTRRYELIGLE